MTCLNCNKETAIVDPKLGVLPCASCQAKTTPTPHKLTELTTDAIKVARRAFRDDTLQPWREGELSKEYIDAHGTKYVDATEEEIKRSRPVWNLDYYNS